MPVINENWQTTLSAALMAFSAYQIIFKDKY